jgi:hypothetical protein
MKYKMVILLFLINWGCSTVVQDKEKLNISNAENYFFTLDFENNTHNHSDISNVFYTTFPHDDPTAGNVIYDREKWINKDMRQLKKKNGLYLYIKKRDDKFFDSNRITTKPYYNLNEKNQQILFVFKGKFPSERGVWPAWWLNGSRQKKWIYKNFSPISTDKSLASYSGKGKFYNTPSEVNGTDWPSAGEIDIIETINGNNIIHNTIHTCPQMCNSEWNHDGEIINCANASSDDPNAGCSGKPYQLQSIEGTFACLWSKTRIRFYYWAPEEDVRKLGGPLSQYPNPDLWKNASLKNEARLLESGIKCENNLYQSWQCNSCEGHNTCTFVNLKMIFNITLCGKWAGNKFDASKNALKNCESYILNEGRNQIHNQFIKIEFVSVAPI